MDQDGNGRTFSNTHSLSSHIAYCHSETRPFPCPESGCIYSAKSQTDLTKHIEVHTNAIFYVCEEAGCDFSARTVFTLQKHVRRIHEGNTAPLYECHTCLKRLLSTRALKSHLSSAHQILPTSGNRRFKYIQGPDGLFRIAIEGMIQAQNATKSDG